MSQVYIEQEEIVSRWILDLRGEVCPFTFVKTKIALEKIKVGEVAMVILDEGPPLENVPRSLKDEGHQIIKAKRVGEAFNLWVRKG